MYVCKLSPVHTMDMMCVSVCLRAALFNQPDPWGAGSSRCVCMHMNSRKSRLCAVTHLSCVHAWRHRRRPLKQWQVHSLVLSHHLQEMAEKREGMHSGLSFAIYAVCLLLMFLLGFDSWAYNGAGTSVRSQFLENQWDEAQLADVSDVRTQPDMWDWLRNVWAPVIFPVENANASTLHSTSESTHESMYGTGVNANRMKNAKASHTAPGEHYLLGKNPIVGEPLLCQLRCKPVPCKTFPWMHSEAEQTRQCRLHPPSSNGLGYGTRGWDTDGENYDPEKECYPAMSIREKWLSAHENKKLYTLPEVVSDLDHLQLSGWIDDQTCQIFTRTVVFSPQSALYTIMKVVFVSQVQSNVRLNA